MAGLRFVSFALVLLLAPVVAEAKDAGKPKAKRAASAPASPEPACQCGGPGKCCGAAAQAAQTPAEQPPKAGCGCGAARRNAERR